MDIGLSLGRCRAEQLPNPRNEGYQQDEADILGMVRREVGPVGAAPSSLPHCRAALIVRAVHSAATVKLGCHASLALSAASRTAM